MVTASLPYGSGMEALDSTLLPQFSPFFVHTYWMVSPCMSSIALLSTSSLIWLDCWILAGVCVCVCVLKFLRRLLSSSGNNFNNIPTLNTSYYRRKYFYVYFVSFFICCVWHSIHEMLFLPNDGMLKSQK